MPLVEPGEEVSPGSVDGVGFVDGFVGLGLLGFLVLLSVVLVAPELPDLEPLSPVELSVLTSRMSAVTDCIVGESGPNSSITPALANAALVKPAAASGPAALHQLFVPTALCLPTILLVRRV